MAFVPAQPTGSADDAPPPTLWGQQPVSAEKRATERKRQRVTGLPAWDPLPPGEIVVRRSRPV